jgi:hypothetical protein
MPSWPEFLDTLEALAASAEAEPEAMAGFLEIPTPDEALPDTLASRAREVLARLDQAERVLIERRDAVRRQLARRH